MAFTLYKSTSTRLSFNSLQDIDSSPVTDATVEATIFDRDGNEIGGTSWPVSLNHTGSGNYNTTLDSDLDIRVGMRYVVEVVATSGTLQLTKREDVYCGYSDQD